MKNFQAPKQNVLADGRARSRIYYRFQITRISDDVAARREASTLPSQEDLHRR
jgi:hypothetical protein